MTMKDQVEIILNEKSKFRQIQSSIDNMYYTFSKASEETYNLEISADNTHLSAEEANCYKKSADRILDYMRTTKFLRGIKKGIDHQLNNLNKQKINIMYVGSGPFATLLLPLIPLYDESQLKISIIDSHKASIESINSLISYFGYNNYFDEIKSEDAKEYQNKEKKKFDVIIIDTLHQALSNEPQVELTHHFIQFLNSDGVLIPEKIKISAVLADFRRELAYSENNLKDFILKIKRNKAKNKRIFLDEIIVLDKNISRYYNRLNIFKNKIHLTNIQAPKHIGRMRRLILLTDILIFEDKTLSEEDNTKLTKPYFDKEISRIKPGMELIFQYQLGSNPMVVIEVI